MKTHSLNLQIPARAMSILMVLFFCSTGLAQDPAVTAEKLHSAAHNRTKSKVTYDGAYFELSYPWGDVPADKGVCTDVVVRSYRALGVDLQKRVHEDMKKNYKLYPRIWKDRKPDKNIDHRRVPNLQTFFARHGKTLTKSQDPKDYKPGDIVAWDLNGNNLTHIGIIVAPPNDPSKRWIVHNIGSGPKLEDRLFDWKIIGHYRYFPESKDKK